jgi:hypothetical protein
VPFLPGPARPRTGSASRYRLLPTLLAARSAVIHTRPISHIVERRGVAAHREFHPLAPIQRLRGTHEPNDPSTERGRSGPPHGQTFTSLPVRTSGRQMIGGFGLVDFGGLARKADGRVCLGEVPCGRPCSESPWSR